MSKKSLCIIAISISLISGIKAQVNIPDFYKSIAKGWNTWDTYSQVSFVHIPEGFTVNLVLKEYKNSFIMRNPLMYKSEQKMTLGAHADFGEYTDQTIDWEEMKFRIQSATDNDNLLILVSPSEVKALKPPVLIAECGILWQLSGNTSKNNDLITWSSGNTSVNLYSTKSTVYDPYLRLYTPYNAYELRSSVGLSTGKSYSIQQIQNVLDRESKKLNQMKSAYGEYADIFDAMQSSIAWNTIYEPQKKRVVTPVSRSWNDWHGGYVLFEWDNYFVAYMSSLYNKELAYTNAIAITNEITEDGFVPNMADAFIKTRDRSEPPVGSFCVREIYRKYQEKWFLEAVYDKLLRWNQWWSTKRDVNGLLVWGSNAYTPKNGNYWETQQSGVNRPHGASLESGMDNSPMYFDIRLDTITGLSNLWDVGLNSLYILDCNALADIAKELGKTTDYSELSARAGKYSKNLNRLWDEKTGIYRNKFTDNSKFSERLSPTSFYTLLTDAPDNLKIDRMMKEHFYNPNEFYSKWMLPSIAMNDTSFKAQNYWQGRIWPPINFLVYLGLRKHGLTQPRKELVEKSKLLFLRNWNETKHVCENYNAITGIGAEKGAASDPYYHWGALLGFMSMIENGVVNPPENKLK